MENEEGEVTFTQAEVERIVSERLEGERAAREQADSQGARYRGALGAVLAAEKQGLPGHVLVLLEKLDPLEQMEYLAAHRAELARAGQAVVAPSPEAGERGLSGEEMERARRGQALIYNNF